MSEFLQDIVSGSSCLGSRRISSSGNCIAYGDFQMYRPYSNSILIGEGQLCNFDKTDCNGGNWKTWKTSIYFLKNKPSLIEMGSRTGQGHSGIEMALEDICYVILPL